MNIFKKVWNSITSQKDAGPIFVNHDPSIMDREQYLEQLLIFKDLKKIYTHAIESKHAVILPSLRKGLCLAIEQMDDMYLLGTLRISKNIVYRHAPTNLMQPGRKIFFYPIYNDLLSLKDCLEPRLYLIRHIIANLESIHANDKGEYIYNF